MPPTTAERSSARRQSLLGTPDGRGRADQLLRLGHLGEGSFGHLGRNRTHGSTGSPSEKAGASLWRLLNCGIGGKAGLNAVWLARNRIPVSDIWSKSQQVTSIFDNDSYDPMSEGARKIVWKESPVISRYWPNKISWSGADGIGQCTG
jgi:hypothetical protein